MTSNPIREGAEATFTAKVTCFIALLRSVMLFSPLGLAMMTLAGRVLELLELTACVERMKGRWWKGVTIKPRESKVIIMRRLPYLNPFKRLSHTPENSSTENWFQRFKSLSGIAPTRNR